MKTMEEIANAQPVVEDLETQYNKMIEVLTEARDNGKPLDELIDEGILGAIVGGLTGATFGPKVMTTICNVLGIDPKGSLGSLMTSRMILTALCTKMGWKI